MLNLERLMSRRTRLLLAAVPILAVSALLTGTACQRHSEDPAPTNLVPVKADKEEQPSPAALKKEDQQPSIKIRRGKDGGYSWEISGRDVNTVLKADRALSRRIGTRVTGKAGAEE